MAWLDGWKRRIPMYIDPTTISGGLSGSETDFPLSIKFSNSAGINNKDLLYFIQQYLPADLSSLNDNFTGGDYHIPNPNRWREDINAYCKMCIKNNKLHYHSTSSINSSGRVRSAYQLSGDFDIQIDYTVVTETNPPSSWHNLTLFISGGGQESQIRRGRKSTGTSRHIVLGSLTPFTEAAEAWSTGKLRITRSGSVIKGYYWDVPLARWEWNGSTNGFTFSETTTADVWVYISFYSVGGATEWEADVDNFTVNSYDSIVKYINNWDYEYFAITAGDGITPLPVEIERIQYTNVSTDYIVMWTKVPEVSNTELTYVYLYYNKDMGRNPVEISYYDKSKAITVMHPDNEGTYDTDSVMASCVRKEGNTYKMWYGGSDGTNYSIMYADSVDGVNWFNHQRVIARNQTAYDTVNAGYPCVVKDGDTYKIWYSGYDAAAWRTLYSTSNDGLNWATPQLVVDKGAQGVYDANHVLRPHVLKENGTYRMWYSGHGPNWSIIYATSNNGTVWSNFQMVIDKNEEGVYDTSHSMGPWVEHDDNKYKMWYIGSDGTNWRSMYTTTSTGINDWGNHQMVIDIGTEGIRDASHAYMPCVLADPYNTTVSGSYLIWYTGRDDSEDLIWRILFTRTYGSETQFTRPAQTVWDDYFVGVWHMEDSPSDNIELESTIKENDLTAVGTFLITGQVGRGVGFDGIDDRLHISDSDYWDFGGEDFTVETWVNPDTATDMEIISKRAAGAEAWIMLRATTSGYCFWASHSPASWDIADSVIIGDITATEFAKLTVSRSGDSWKLYKNLVESPNSFTTSSGDGDLQTDANDLDFGFDKALADHLDGTLDEVRISKGIGRSYDYVKLSYYSETDDLLTFRDPEYRLIPEKYIEPVDDYGGDTVRIWGTLTSESWQAYVYAYWGDSDAGEVKNNWDYHTFISLENPGDNFDTVIDVIPFITTYYRFFATFSGSDPTEEWSPSYSYYNAKGKILKGTSNNFVAVCSEPDSTFYNTRFAAVSYGEGNTFNIVSDDVVVGCNYGVHIDNDVKDTYGDNLKFKLIIDSSKINSTLTNYPIRVKFGSDSGINSFDATDIFDTLGANSKKLRIVTENGTQCYVEIEQWDNGNEVANLWVRVPSISSSQNTILYVCYNNGWADNNAYIGVVESVPGETVWDSNYKGVWHLNQDPSGVGNVIKDSTSNDNDGDPFNMEAGDKIDAKIGKGLSFDGSDEYINLGAPASLLMTGTNSISIESWVKLTSTIWYGIVARGQEFAAYGNYILALRRSDIEMRYRAAGASYVFQASSLGLDIGTWYHVAFKYTYGTGSSAKFLINGEEVSGAWLGPSGAANPDAGTAVNIARDNGFNGPRQYFNGALDDLRISKYLRSDAWIKAGHYSGDDNLIYFRSVQLAQSEIQSDVSDLTSVR